MEPSSSSPESSPSPLRSWVVWSENGQRIGSAATAEDAVREMTEERWVQPGETVKVVSWEQYNVAHAVVVQDGPSDSASVENRLAESGRKIYAALMAVAVTMQAPAMEKSPRRGNAECRSFELEE